ncbi:prephenate dehydrogenase [Hydrogenobacter hydrogenophilus]|uniref:prephenate dehydrogenase n=1 Tax=Hydrogenobacter hydrogenophilus TaxID=35835 RepID=A0A285NSE2_9AQUI|nr:prephenate dehydrogenase/arogenate dehydrogenase family protein [Hydrogenobacter hydrogenophilus]SNZ12098.1 prephenate dehydrogenase [Hydrogenobacter hydrogenophilus]
MFKRLCVIGVGFMGGSFALAFRESFPNCEILGIDINPYAIDKAIQLGVIDKGSVQMNNLLLFKPDLIMLATPVGTFESIAKELSSLDLKDSLITDLGSVKGRLVYMLEEYLGENFVGGHPIAGTEKSGVENSNKDLFKGKRCILTPTQRTSPKALEKIKNMWVSLGALVEEMDPFLHDYVFGAVSHLPHAVAFALIDAIKNLSKDSVDLFKYPGGGFKDFTRIAGSDPIMWRDIFLENRENVLKAIEAFEMSLKNLKELIKSGNLQELTDYLLSAKNCREKIN